MNQLVRVLATKSLDQSLVERAWKAGIEIIAAPMIKIEFISSDSLPDMPGVSKYDALVFTSKNGVEGFKRIFDQQELDIDGLAVFAVGEKTAEALEFLDKNIVVPEKHNAASLAKTIMAKDNIKSVLVVCGDHARKELQELLEQGNITVEKLIVYHTIQSPHKVNLDQYKAVLFISPSAVKSFFSANQDQANLVYFAIGTTTETALREFTAHPVIVAGQPDVESLINKVQEYFF